MKKRKNPRTNLFTAKGVSGEYYKDTARTRGLSIAEMRDVTSRIRNGHLSKAEANEILKHEKSKFIKWRIRKAVEKAERKKIL